MRSIFRIFRTHGFQMLLPACLILSGCQPMIGWMVNAFAPPQKIDAVYTPPEGKAIAVFVDDIKSPDRYEPIKRELTERLNEQLIEHNIAINVASYDDMLRLMAATPEFNKLAISEVGQKLGAEMVLYVHVDRFSLRDSAASPLWRGRLQTTIHIVDVLEGRIWPDDRLEYPVKPVTTPGTTDMSPTYETRLVKIMAIQMADRIAKLFYDHEVSAQEAAQMEQEDQEE